MNGPHDIGGRQGFGPVVAEPDEPVFHADWERRVFALSFCSWFASGVAVDQSRDVQARMPYPRYYGSSYYERWLYALERIMVERGVLDWDEIESGVASRAAPTGAIAPDRLAAAVGDVIDRGVERFSPAPTEPVFSPGVAVRVRAVNPSHYVRVPSYLKRARGTIDAHCGTFSHPEDLERAAGGAPGAHCYRVRFAARDLWGESAEQPGDALCVDLFESYLQPA